MKTPMLDKATTLRIECLTRLEIHKPKVRSKFGDFYGFRITEHMADELDIDFVEIMYINLRWFLLNKDGYRFTDSVLTTEHLCYLTDLITQKKGK